MKAFSSLARKTIRSARKRLGLRVANKQSTWVAPVVGRTELPETVTAFVDRLPSVLQYRRAYFDTRGHVAPGPALPTSRAWPRPDNGLSYKEKLTGLLIIQRGHGAEIGPLNIPLIEKGGHAVLYVDHLDTAGLKKKYAGLDGIVDIDRPMVNDSLSDTLREDAPLDYLCASQVFEHVPNPIRWLKEIYEVLRVGGLVALSLPDRRMTFDLFREESSAADIVAVYYDDVKVPDVRAVYDNQILATAVNMHWRFEDSMTPDEVFRARGAASPRVVSADPLGITEIASKGSYLDAHCWVFTPPGFLIVMSQLAESGLLPFKCNQFYPTNERTPDRGSSSFTVILEKVPEGAGNAEISRSFLMALGD